MLVNVRFQKYSTAFQQLRFRKRLNFKDGLSVIDKCRLCEFTLDFGFLFGCGLLMDDLRWSEKLSIIEEHIFWKPGIKRPSGKIIHRSNSNFSSLIHGFQQVIIECSTRTSFCGE